MSCSAISNAGMIATMTETEWICASCKSNGRDAQPAECPDCGDVHFWNFASNPLVPITLRYAEWLSSTTTAFRRPLH